MSQETTRQHQIGDYWLWQKPTGIWCICHYHKPTRSTRREATGIRGGDKSNPPRTVLDLLANKYLDATKKERSNPEEVLVMDLLVDFFIEHGSKIASAEQLEISYRHFQGFLNFHPDTKGRAALLSDINPNLIRSFMAWRSEPHTYKYKNHKGKVVTFSHQGVCGTSIDRNCADIRSALNWNWKENRITSTPYIPHVKLEDRSPPRERILSKKEIAALLEAAHAKREDYPQIMIYLMIAFNTGGRPEAIYDLHSDWALDKSRWLLQMNEPKRAQTNKLRPTIPVTQTLMPWISGLDGWFISHERRKDKEIIKPYGVLQSRSMKTIFKTTALAAGMDDISPITIRHTVATILRERGVDEWEAEGFTGHGSKSTTGINYAKFRPDYFSKSREAIDGFFKDLETLTTAHLRFVCGSVPNIENVTTFRKK